MRCRRGTIKVDIQEVLNVVLCLPTRRTISRARASSNRGSDWVFGGILALFLDGSALDLVGAKAALAYEGLGRLVVYRGER